MTTLVNIAPVPKFQFSQNGVPLNGGKLFTYAAGTMNKLATYTDQSGTTPNTNPIILDANGQGDCWLASGVAYKLILSPSTDTDPPTNPYWTEDNITSPSLNVADVQSGAYNYATDTGTTVNAYVVSLTPAIPATIPDGFPVNFSTTRPNTGPATLNGIALVDYFGNALQSNVISGECSARYSTAFSSFIVLSRANFLSAVNLFDYLTPVQISDVQAFTLAHDVTAAVQAWASALGPMRRGYAPNGAYKLSNQINFPNTCEVFGDGFQSSYSGSMPAFGTVFVCTFLPAVAANVFYATSAHTAFRNLEIFCNYQPADAVGWTPTTTPNAIQFYRAPYAVLGADDPIVDNVMIRAMTTGVLMLGVDRGEIKVYGQTLGSLLLIDGCYDVAHIHVVHYWTYYAMTPNIQAWINANVDCIYLGRVDNPQFGDLFSFNCRSGLRFGPSAATPSGGVSRAQIAKLGVDNCFYGILVNADATSGPAEAAIGSFYSYNSSTGTTTNPTRAIYNVGTQPAYFEIASLDCTGAQGEIIRADVANAQFHIGHARVRNYNQVNNNYAAFDNTTGAGTIISIDSWDASTANGNGAAIFRGTGFQVPGNYAISAANPGYEQHWAQIGGIPVLVTRNFGRLALVAAATAYTAWTVTLPIAHANKLLSVRASLGSAPTGAIVDALDNSALPATLTALTGEFYNGGTATTVYIDWETVGY